MSILKRMRTVCGVKFIAAVMLLAMTCSTQANFGDLFGRSSVGGISINAEGVLAEITQGDAAAIRRARLGAMEDIPEALNDGAEMRKVSLRDLQQAIIDSGETDLAKLPNHIRYMAGLQRVQYVFVYPEKNDIVLVGPGEGWTVNENGDVVGQQSQLPVMNLEDLLGALRFAFSTQRNVISCSIDPTAEGMKRFEKVNASFQANPPKPRVAMKQIQDAIGPQSITVQGIDPHSRMARVLVAADYRMKRLAMGFDKPPVRGLPSFVSMLKSPKVQNMMPRWWLEDDYEAVFTDEKGLSFELRGQGVKAMTEDEILAEDGTRVGTGKVDPLAKRWADNMTKRYASLSKKAPVFAELRNCIDLTVVAALIASEDLPRRAGLDIVTLLDDVAINVPRYVAATQVPTIVNATKVRGYTAITASGGVSVNPWQIAASRKIDAAVTEQREAATEPSGAAWWWN